MREALQIFAAWLGAVAVFGIFWTLLKGLPNEPEDDDPDGSGRRNDYDDGPDGSGPPASGA